MNNENSSDGFKVPFSLRAVVDFLLGLAVGVLIFYYYPVVKKAWFESDRSIRMPSTRALKGLGYADGTTRTPAETGILTYDTKKSQPGLNLYVSAHAPRAYLMDMKGNIIHRWEYSWEKAFPDRNPYRMKSIFGRDRTRKYTSTWRKVHVYENGDLLAIFEGFGLIKIDRNSNLLWKKAIKTHHDVWVTPEKNIYVLTRKIQSDFTSKRRRRPIVNEFVTVLDSDGEILKEISILEAIFNSQYSGIISSSRLRGIILHTNSIRVLGTPRKSFPPAFEKGRVLLSFNKTNNIALLDLEKRKIVWALPSMSQSQHDAQILDNGNILFFNNNSRLKNKDNHSQIVEVDPLTQEIKWEYTGTPPNEFYSKCCGTNQRLKNGNTLITETGDGRAFEVTPEGEIVWEFVIPHKVGEKDALIAQLFELERLPLGFGEKWINNAN